MRILYTHRTQGVGAEGAHIRGMYEAFRYLGHAVSMHCLPGCDPSERAQAERARAQGAEAASGSGARLGNTSATGNANATEAAAQARPSLLKRVYWTIAERAPQIVFEAIELGYNGLLFSQLLIRCLRQRPDLVYERYSLNTFAPTLVCGLLGLRHVLEVNDSVVIERSRPLKLKGLSALCEGYCLRQADLSVTITERFRRRLLERFALAEAKVMVLTNAVDGKRFGAIDRGIARARLGLGASTTLGGSGQFLAWHGLQELIERMGPEAEALDLRFLFIGDGPARQAVMDCAAALGAQDRVRFTGMLPIDQVPASLAALDMAVIPKAAPHASPMKLIEYMAMGLPIVAPDLPSIREALGTAEGEGRTAAIFPDGDMGKMREAILAWLRDPGAAKAAGARARERALAELTWDRHAEKVLRALGL